MDINNATYAWETHEYHFTPKRAEWFTALGVIAGGSILASIVLGNYLFAIFLLLSAAIAIIFALRHPKELRYEINPEGVVAGTTFYPYSTLGSFSLTKGVHGSRLLLISKRFFMPVIVIPLGEEDPYVIRGIIEDFLEEGEHVEPMLFQLAERLGL